MVHTATDLIITEVGIYLKDGESNVEIWGLVSVLLARLLHQRHNHVFLTYCLGIIMVNLESILWVSPETVWKRERREKRENNSALQRV